MQDTAAVIFAFLAGLIIGGGLVWLIARARLVESTAALNTQNAVLREALEQERKQAREKSAIETETARTLQKQNRQEIDLVLTPLRDKLKDFQDELRKANEQSVAERAVLADQIKALSQTSATMTAETTNLTRALRGESQTQGAWGELVLSSVLEKSGLREGEEYIAQQSHTDEDGQRLRPDAIVHLPGGQKIVIDSKVSLTAFEAYDKADNENDRAQHLDRHLLSVRTHIKGLGGKDYHRIVGGDIDYVIMFVPIEGALACAQRNDPELSIFALENDVVMATPNTLIGVLRTVANIWQVERRNRNAEAIALRAGKMYDKLVSFVDSLKEVGARLHQAQSSFGDAMSKLATGRGNLINQAEQLKELGARTGKSLPEELTGTSDVIALAPAKEDAA